MGESDPPTSAIATSAASNPESGLPVAPPIAALPPVPVLPPVPREPPVLDAPPVPDALPVVREPPAPVLDTSPVAVMPPVLRTPPVAALPPVLARAASAGTALLPFALHAAVAAAITTMMNLDFMINLFPFSNS
jgi:hypothetical protein